MSNYYDSIHLDELRRVFVSLVNANEVVVDLLFKVIEGISWVPDYLPYSKRGLPTANVEAVRLLAHSFLFEIDAVLKEKTNDSFTRWMDDITIGVNTEKDAIGLLSTISDMLKSRGLALNLAKTNIYDANQAKHHFQIEQNLFLDKIEEVKPSSKEAEVVAKDLVKRFRVHFKDKSAKAWDKVAKRYITAFGRLKSNALLTSLPKIYISFPGLRTNLLIYLATLGYSKRSARAVSEILDNLQVFDDLSLFQIADLLVKWEIPLKAAASTNFIAIESKLAKLGFAQKEPLGFYSLLWVKAKYSSSISLLKFLIDYRPKWQTNSFLRRQATICLARLVNATGGDALGMLNEQSLSGVPGTVSVANLILQLAKLTKLEPRLRLYLFPTFKQRVYPFSKFMVLCAALNSASVREDPNVQKNCLEYINDPVFKSLLSIHYGIAAQAP